MNFILILWYSWRSWLEEAEPLFIVCTNHENFLYFQATKELNARQVPPPPDFFFMFNFIIT